MSEPSKNPTSQARVSKWTFLWSLLVLALGVVALAVAQSASRARKAHEEKLATQEEKLVNLQNEIAAVRANITEQQQKAAAQREAIRALRRSSVQIRRAPVTLNKTGNEVCSERGEICIAVTPSKVYDDQDRFCGYNMFDCNSRIRPAEGCGRTAAGDVYNFQIDRTTFTPSPGAEGTCDAAARVCLKDDYHNDAICASELADRPDRAKADNAKEAFTP